MIYDCITFFNELDILELRFTELNDVVDRFVIAEAPITCSGKAKPMLFLENAHRFAPWRERIIHVVVDDMPTDPNPWSRENFQREAITRGLVRAKPSDKIIISDCDEIPHPDAIKSWNPTLGPHSFNQIFSYYWINCVKGEWQGSRIALLKQLKSWGGPNALRKLELPTLPNGGWHFSFFGGPKAIRTKLDAYAHQELNRGQFKAESYLQQVIHVGIDLFGRETPLRFFPIDARFPRTVLSQREKYAHLIREATFHEDLYCEKQLLRMCALLSTLESKMGAIIEIGCWEGKSTIGLAHACYPESLLAVDDWNGRMDSSLDQESIKLSKERDIFGQFICNTGLLTKGNIIPTRMDCHKFIRSWNGPIKFMHIDGSQDYRSVKTMIELTLPWVVSGGILCGNNFEKANIHRHDLDGGVERAICEVLPDFVQDHNLWYWKHP